MRVLVTGGAGFIGHHLVEHFLRATDWEVVLLDRLDLSGTLSRIKDIGCFEEAKHRLLWVFHDFKAPIREYTDHKIGDIDMVFHLGASTHVDRSIDDPMQFVMDNVVGTTNMLDWTLKRVREQESPHRDADIRFFYFSTDEVFGPAPEGVSYGEWSRYKSGNPYAASKAGAEEMCLAYHNTYGLDVVITHCMNVFGERQHPEKFIPSTIRKILKGDKVLIHANQDKTKAGSRFYIHARNVASAVLFLVGKAKAGEKYNIVGEKEIDNLSLAKYIAEILNRPLNYEMVDFHSSRPGHDLRYALSGKRMEMMGWKIPVGLGESLSKTIEWTVKHPEWLL